MKTDTPSVAPHSGIVEKLRPLIARLRDGLKSAEYRPGDHPAIPVRIADFMQIARDVLPEMHMTVVDLIDTLTSPVEGMTLETTDSERGIWALMPVFAGTNEARAAHDLNRLTAHIATLNAALAAEKARADMIEDVWAEAEGKITDLERDLYNTASNRDDWRERATTSEAARVKAEKALREINEPALIKSVDAMESDGYLVATVQYTEKAIRAYLAALKEEIP